MRLTENDKFSSPTAAGAVLLGRSVAGPEWWKDSTRKTLKQLRTEAIAETGEPPEAVTQM
jgi:hypothetical protein